MHAPKTLCQDQQTKNTTIFNKFPSHSQCYKQKCHCFGEKNQVMQKFQEQEDRTTYPNQPNV